MHSQAEKEAERATKWAGMAQHAQHCGEDLHTFIVNSKVRANTKPEYGSRLMNCMLVHQACL